MKKNFYKIGKMITAPFYYIHKGLVFIEENDMFGLLISVGVLLLGIGTFLHSANFHDGEWISEILFFFFCSMLFSLLAVVCYVAKMLFVPILLLVFGVFASLYHFFSEEFISDDQQTEKEEQAPSFYTYDKQAHNPTYPCIKPGCGMNHPM